MTAIGLSAMGILDVANVKTGDPERLINGMDYHGNVCGVTNYLTPHGNDTVDLPMAYFLPSGMAVCVESCPDEDDFESFHCKYEVGADIDLRAEIARSTGGDGAANSTRRTLHLLYTSSRQCMPYIATRPRLGYCRPGGDMDDVAAGMNREYEAENVTGATNLTIAKNSASGSGGGGATSTAKPWPTLTLPDTSSSASGWG